MRFSLSVIALALFSASAVLAVSPADTQAPNVEKAAVAGGNDAGLGSVKAQVPGIQKKVQGVAGTLQGLNGGGKGAAAKEKRHERDGKEHAESDEPDHDDRGDVQEELKDKLEDDP